MGRTRCLRSRSVHLNRVRRLNLPRTGKIMRTLQGCRDIIEALAAGDPDAAVAAVAAVREHLSQTVNRFGALQERFPDYFSA
jgi:DNA-binding GntR family transcriptional regulator